jgi:PAT family beta-lactamase induction signal transducer AmpG
MGEAATPTNSKPGLREVLAQPRMIVILLLGAASGLPNAMSESTLQAWGTTLGFTNSQIGDLMYGALPYLLKPIWAPFMDRFTLPWLGRRRGWIAFTQILLCAAIAAMAFVGRETPLATIGLVVLLIAFLSASQDIVINAYTTDVTRPAERGVAAVATNLGYRAAAWGGLAIALVVADQIGWREAFFAVAALMLAFVFVTTRSPEPEDPRGTVIPSFRDSVVIPLRELFGAPGVIALVILIVCYKIGDAFAVKFFTAFLLHVGFTLTEIGLAVKFLLVTGTIVGAALGGIWMIKLGLRHAMLLFALVQALTNLGYLLLEHTGKNYAVMIGAVGLDALASGMGNIASTALIMAMCDKRFTAFQYALLSVFAMLPRYTLSKPAGILADYGWNEYYLVSFALAIPGVVLVWVMRERIGSFDNMNLGGKI